MADQSLNIIVKLVDQASSGLKSFAWSVDKAGDSIDRSTEKAQKFTKVVTAVWIAVGAYALKQFADFEKTMSGVQAVLQPTTAEFDQLWDTVKQLGKDTIFTQGEIARAVEELGKQGLSTQQILDGAIKSTSDLASAAGTSLETAATIAADAMNIFNIEAKNMSDAVNQITGVANASKLSVEDYSLAISQGWGYAKQAWVSFTDFNSVMAATANYFAKGSDQGTSFKQFLMQLTPTSDKAAEAMDKIWFSAYDAAGNLLPMSEIAERLHNSLKDLNDEAKNEALKIIFWSDAARMAGAIAEQGAAGLDKVAEAIRKTDAAAQAATRLNNFWGDLEKLKGTIDVLATDLWAKLSEYLRPAIRGVTEALNDMTGWFASLSPGMQKFIEYAGIAAVAVGGLVFAVGAIGIALPAILSAVSAISSALAFLVSPVGLVIAAITALGIAYKTNFLWFRDIVNSAVTAIQPLLDKIVEGFKAVVEDVMKYINLFKEAFIPVWNEMLPHVMRFLEIIQTYFVGTFQNLVTILTGAWDIIKGIFQVALNLIMGWFTLFFQVLTGNWSGAWETIKTMTQWVWEGIVSILTGVLEIINGIFGQFINTISTMMNLLWTGILAAVTEYWQLITNKVSEQWTVLKGIFAAGQSLITSAWTSFSNGLFSIMKGVWDSIKNVISEGIEWAVQKINAAIALANMIPGVNITPIGWEQTAPEIAGARAMGGPVDAGRTYLVGERGMELFTPSSDGYITPNDALGGGVNITFWDVSVRDDMDIKKIASAVEGVLTRNLQLYKLRSPS